MPGKTVKTFLIARRGRPTSYPWSKWTDGEIHTKREGRDFKVAAKDFARTVHRHAQVNGLKVVVRRRGTCVKFQFTPSQSK